MHDCDELVTRVHRTRLRGAESWKILHCEETWDWDPCLKHLRDREEHIPRPNQGQNFVHLDLRSQHSLCLTPKKFTQWESMEDGLIDLIV